MMPATTFPKSEAPRWKWCRISISIAGWRHNRPSHRLRAEAIVEHARFEATGVADCRDVAVRSDMHRHGPDQFGNPRARRVGRARRCRCAEATPRVVQPLRRPAAHARAAARRMEPDAPNATTSPRRTRAALGDFAAGTSAANPGTPDALDEDDSGTTPPVARERTHLPRSHARGARQGQRSVPQIPIPAAGRASRLARTLAHDDARTATPLGHRTCGQTATAAPARSSGALKRTQLTSRSADGATRDAGILQVVTFQTALRHPE